MFPKQSLILLILWIHIMMSIDVLHAQTGERSLDMVLAQIRAAYWGIKDVTLAEEQLRQLKAHGFNAALIKDGGYPVRENLWQGWGEYSQHQEIKLFPVLNFAGQSEIGALQGTYTPYISTDGTVLQKTPCPLDARYWEASIGRRFEQLARLSKRVALSGILFDTEMYGSEIAIYNDVCLCDVCWSAFFMMAQQHVPGVEAKNRREYLADHGLLERYTQFQEHRLQTILTPIGQRLHMINPALMLGIVAYKDTWFYRGLLCGLGTPENPIAVFSETSYLQGYTPHIHQQKRILSASPCAAASNNGVSTLQPLAHYIPGLWLGRFFPEEVSSQLYNLATHTYGYWIFTADSLWSEIPLEEPYALHGKPDEYWRALQKANEELRAFSSAPASHQSQLAPVYQSSFYDHTQERLITQPSLSSLMQVMAFNKALKSQWRLSQPSEPITYRGKVLLHCYHDPSLTLPRADETGVASSTVSQASQSSAVEPAASGSIKIMHIQLGQYTDTTHYTLFDAEGIVLMEGHLKTDRSCVELSFSPEISGLVSLLVDSGTNASQVMFSGVPFAIEASTTFPLATNMTARSYTLYVPPEQSWLTVRAYCSTNEVALLSFYSPDNRITEHCEVTGFTDFRIPLSQRHSGELPGDASARPLEPALVEKHFWKLAVSPVPQTIFDDVQFHLYNHEFPYLFVDESQT